MRLKEEKAEAAEKLKDEKRIRKAMMAPKVKTSQMILREESECPDDASEKPEFKVPHSPMIKKLKQNPSKVKNKNHIKDGNNS